MDQTRVLSIFLSVARTNSFTQAALAAGLTPPAVSRAIAQLEEHLGARLPHRRTSFGNRHLIPLIRQFPLTYPDIHFDLLFEDQFTDLVTAKIDVGFRSG